MGSAKINWVNYGSFLREIERIGQYFLSKPSPWIDAWMSVRGVRRKVFPLGAFLSRYPRARDDIIRIRKLCNVHMGWIERGELSSPEAETEEM